MRQTGEPPVSTMKDRKDLMIGTHWQSAAVSREDERIGKSRKRSALQATPLEQSLTIAVASLREGEVVSYGDIAVRAGRPRAPRAAGAFLARSVATLARSVSTLPWWRVVYSDGRLPSCNPTLQTRCLEEEGVLVRGGRVRLAPFGRFADASR